ncbi:YgdB family protein [Photorhabdus temperata]|uniref:YgdB family protein n=1 Tax=Photorhabdus temperata TaxID=574560 RepID=UPI00040D8858|nr:YgdB family protein [Photorhabdus temperata]
MTEHSPNVCLQFQQGNVLLISVLMLLAVSLMMLKALHHHLDNALIMMVDERRYLKAFQQAESALAWGMAQSWLLYSDKTEEWYCLQQQEFHLTSCLKRYSSNFFSAERCGGNGIWAICRIVSMDEINLFWWK